MPSTDRDAAFISALTTEHFVIQSSMSATNTESGQRASLYVFSLSSALVALGFLSQTPRVFTPFVATVLPAVFLLGVFTSVRLIDANLEMMQLLAYVARIRQYYRTLSPDAEELFSPETGRWPEAKRPPALGLGLLFAYITTNASMVAFINSIVGGAGIALLVWHWLAKQTLAVSLGVLSALALMALFLLFQRWRYEVAMPSEVRAVTRRRK
jgi:hypothetical protein